MTYIIQHTSIVNISYSTWIWATRWRSYKIFVYLSVATPDFITGVWYVMLIIVCILYCGFWLDCLYFVSWHLVFLNAISSWNYSAGVVYLFFFKVFHYHSKCNIVIILSQNQQIVLRYLIISLLKCLCNSLHQITWSSECEKSNM